jgi:hypothetical protein
VIIPQSHSCLGSVLSRGLLQYFIGYDTTVINWAIASFGARGYIYNYHSQELFSLNIAFDFISLSINPLSIQSPSLQGPYFELGFDFQRMLTVLMDLLRLKVYASWPSFSIGTIVLYKVSSVNSSNNFVCLGFRLKKMMMIGWSGGDDDFLVLHDFYHCFLHVTRNTTTYA